MKRALLLPLLLAASLPMVRAGEPPVPVASVRPPSRPRADSFPLMPADAGVLKEVKPFVAFRRTKMPVDPVVTVLFLGRTRPVRLEMRFEYDGALFAQRWEAVVKELFKGFDRDGDGYLNRHEAELVFAASEVKSLLTSGYAFRSVQNGALPSLDTLDRDGDGRVSFEELAAYYDDQLDGMPLLYAYPANAFPDPITAELFSRLDVDGDGRITAEEWKAAERLFALLDSDEDECLSVQEFLANPKVKKVAAAKLGGDGADMMAKMPAVPKKGGPAGTAHPDTVVAIGPLPGSVVQRILAKYDKDGDLELTRDELPGLSAADFAKLDANGNGKVSASELDTWRTMPADIVVRLDIQDDRSKARTRYAKGQGLADGLDLPDPKDHRGRLFVAGQMLDFAPSGQPAGFPPTANHVLAGLFAGDKKVVEERELDTPSFQYLRVVFECADLNGDGKLTREEADEYHGRQKLVAGMGTAVHHLTRPPNLFALIDADGDGKISMRELRTAHKRLLPLEPSGGGAVTKAVLQPTLALRAGPRNFAAADPVFSAGTGMTRENVAPARGPAWFRKMDRNGDGDVSRAEFLGSKADFDAIDTDGDGYISAAEAEAFDAKSRKPSP